MHWSEVWFGTSAGAKTARVLLAPASFAYALGWEGYASAYRLGLKRAKHPHSPVLCVGNLTVGGSGKTPVTIYIAELLTNAGQEVAISCSGYGSEGQHQASLAPEGPLSASRWGDEAALLRDRLPQISLIVGRNRVQAGQLCHANFPQAVLLLDDGFQHLPLAKDISILLDEPRPNRLCLPAGPYREPSSHRRYGTTTIPGEFRLCPLPLQLLDPSGALADWPRQASVLCALGSPQRFIEAVQNAGVTLLARIVRPDHDPLTEGNLFDEIGPDEPLIVTEKDWVKLCERADIKNRRILIARYTVEVCPQTEFRNWLLNRLDEANATRT